MKRNHLSRAIALTLTLAALQAQAQETAPAPQPAGDGATTLDAIQVTARKTATHVHSDVADQGRGNAPEELGAVFDKYSRAKHRDRTVPGTGLGLAICTGSIEAHGGTVPAGFPSPALDHAQKRIDMND